VKHLAVAVTVAIVLALLLARGRANEDVALAELRANRESTEARRAADRMARTQDAHIRALAHISARLATIVSNAQANEKAFEAKAKALARTTAAAGPAASPAALQRRAALSESRRGAQRVRTVGPSPFPG